MDDDRKCNLKMLLGDLINEQPNIESLYLFGSRAYGTGSTRSDCDILVRVPDGKDVKSSALRDFAIENCTALDFFIATGGHAVSCINGSFVYAATFEQLADRLDAILLWERSTGFKEIEIGWVFEVNPFVDHKVTTLPNTFIGELTWQSLIANTEQAGLPTTPYIGDTVDKATAVLTDVIKRMLLKPSDLAQRGQAKSGWTVKLASEYDCQNLFYTVVKPWISSIGKEEVTIRYDKQEKTADFNFFNSKLIIEMKFIDDDDKKREVVKTLSGLREFYVQNSNIEVLLFIIFVKQGVDIDKDRWAADYTFIKTRPRVITHVFNVP